MGVALKSKMKKEKLFFSHVLSMLLSSLLRGGETSAQDEVIVFLVHLLSLAPPLQFQRIKEDATPKSKTNPREINKGGRDICNYLSTIPLERNPQYT